MMTFRHAGTLKIAALSCAILLGAVVQGLPPVGKSDGVATEIDVPRIMPAVMSDEAAPKPQARILVIPRVMVRHPVPVPFFLPPIQHHRMIVVPHHQSDPQQHGQQRVQPEHHVPGVAI